MLKKTIAIFIAALTIVTSAIPAMANNVSPDAFFNIGGCMYATANTTAEQRDTAVRAFNMLPENIREGLLTEDCHINIFSRVDDNTMNPNHQAITMFPSFVTWDDGFGNVVAAEQQGEYYIDIDAAKIMRENGQSILHEVGHFVDGTYDGGFMKTLSTSNVSGVEHFQELYDSEKDALATIGKSSKYNVYSAKEFWAEGFACYILYPEKVRELCPRLAGAVEFVINTYDYTGNHENPVPVMEQEEDDVLLYDIPENNVKEDESNVEENDFISETPVSEADSQEDVAEDEVTISETVKEVSAPPRTQQASKTVTRPKKKNDAYIRYNGYEYHTTKERAQEIADKINEENRRKAKEEEQENVEEPEGEQTFLAWLVSMLFG